uniref:peptidylprolyl isomerase n=1 Tax=Strigamia maritima TaxID=126957 RepID=T1J225_STRMM
MADSVDKSKLLDTKTDFKRPRNEEVEEDDDDSSDSGCIGPFPEEAAKPKKRKVLPYGQVYLSNIPSTEVYEKSYMHRETVTHIAITKTEFVITASSDGHVKFWKKDNEGIEFVKHFRSHIGNIQCLSVSSDGMLLCTGSNDKSLKVFDVVNFDMINMMRLDYVPGCCEWVYCSGDAISALAVSDSESSKIFVYDGNGTNKPLKLLETLHRQKVVIIKYNSVYEVVVSVDQSGMLEYWTGPKKDYRFPKNFFESKLDTDLYEFVKNKTHPTCIAFSNDGKQFATISSDRKVRVFKFVTGKLSKVFDESLQYFTELQQTQQLLPNMEFGRRMAVERDLEKSEAFHFANITFDESGHFILYATMIGVKVINLYSSRCVRLIGKPENIRFLQLAIFQGRIKKVNAAVTVEMQASDNPNLEGVLCDPTLFCTGFKKNRFYMFTKREPEDTKTVDNERDVFNEKPSKEDIIAATESSGTERLYNNCIIHTSLGDIHCTLFAKECPKSVENFCVHAKGGYYNTHVFHRVIKGFMIQTGDPVGCGTGGESIWGGEFEDEFHPALRHDKPYTLSMANAGPNTNGSQFFVTVIPTPWLDNKHTVFGRVTRGMEVVQNISNVKTNPKTDKPYDDVIIHYAEIKPARNTDIYRHLLKQTINFKNQWPSCSMAASNRVRSLRSGRSVRNRYENSEDIIKIDYTKDPTENVKEILRNIIKRGCVNKAKKLAYLSSLVNIRLCLFNEAREVRAAGLRAIRYLLQDEAAIDALWKLQFDHLIARSLDIFLDNQTERLQALRIMRQVVHTCPVKFPSAFTMCLISIANDGSQQRDHLLRAALATLSELVILNPDVVEQSSIVSSLLRNILDCQHARISESLIGTIIFLLNHPKTRSFIKPKVDLECIVAPFTDCHYRHTSESLELQSDEREIRFTASKMAILSTLRSWPGMIRLCRPRDSGLQSLIDVLYLPCEDVRKGILDILFELFRLPIPEWTEDFSLALLAADSSTMQESWKLYDGFIVEEGKSILPHLSYQRPNLLENYLALLLLAFINVGILEAIVDVIVSSSSKLSVRATVLLGELLHLANTRLPYECSHHSHCLPTLVAVAASFDTPPEHRHCASAAITCLNRVHALKKRGPIPSSLFLEQLMHFASKNVEMHSLKDRNMNHFLGKDTDELTNQAIKDSHVLSVLDPAQWDWNTIDAIFKLPGNAFQKLEDNNHKQFLRKVVQFYKPSSKQFSSFEQNREESRQIAKVGCRLMNFLVLIREVEGAKIMEEFLIDLGDCLSKVIAERAPLDAIFSPSRMMTTLSQCYFLFVGRLTRSKRGKEALERSGILQCILKLISITSHESYLKLVVSSLDYSQEGMSRIIFSKILNASPESSRLYATNMIRILVRLHLPDFSKWGMELLVTQVYDESRSVSLAALDILDEACDEVANLEALIALRPSLLHLGDRGQLLLVRFLSTPLGFKYLNNANYVNHEMDKWRKTYCLKYDVITALVHTVKLQETQNDDQILHFKAALWALGHVGSSTKGVLLLNDEQVIQDIVKLAEESPVFSIRGTCFNVLALISLTPTGADLLSQLGWESVRYHRREQWPILKEADVNSNLDDYLLEMDLEDDAIRSRESSHASTEELEARSPSILLPDNQKIGFDPLTRLRPSASFDSEMLYAGSMIEKYQTLPHSRTRFSLIDHSFHQRTVSEPQPPFELGSQLAAESSNSIHTSPKINADKPRLNISANPERNRSRSFNESVSPFNGSMSSRSGDKLRSVSNIEIVQSEYRDHGVTKDEHSNESSHTSKSRSDSYTDSTSGIGSSDSSTGRLGVVTEHAQTLSPIASSTSLNTTSNRMVHHSDSIRKLVNLRYTPIVPRQTSQGYLSHDHVMPDSGFTYTMSRDAAGYAALRSMQRRRIISADGDPWNIGRDRNSEWKANSCKDTFGHLENGLEYHSVDNCLKCTKVSTETSTIHQKENLQSENLALDFVNGCDDVSAETTPGSFSSAGSTEGAGDGFSNHIVNNEDQVLIRKEVLRLVINLSSSAAVKSSEQGLLSLKQKMPVAFQDLCLYSEILLLMSRYKFRITARRFLHELFLDVTFNELYDEPSRILKMHTSTTEPDASNP